MGSVAAGARVTCALLFLPPPQILSGSRDAAVYEFKKRIVRRWPTASRGGAARAPSPRALAPASNTNRPVPLVSHWPRGDAKLYARQNNNRHREGAEPGLVGHGLRTKPSRDSESCGARPDPEPPRGEDTTSHSIRSEQRSIETRSKIRPPPAGRSVKPSQAGTASRIRGTG